MRKPFLSLILSAALVVPVTAVLAHEPGTYESPIVEQRVKRFKQSGADIQAIFKSIWAPVISLPLKRRPG